ncbi:hypothetical protein BOTBODRAFT_189427 [Botryobasidium botryosum FD-172 SS1]|uniref:Protein kinase domain-containing protein n=1 Tax=Botryobasidium botryosum (strain FD-172 SS1) TaxID=930990 RepID=A0A067M996_BOTB1|nr:hypothetical protein BOTBODRAFT_189427 [Botryobasidium botryosum FD-172 SS1]
MYHRRMTEPTALSNDMHSPKPTLSESDYMAKMQRLRELVPLAPSEDEKNRLIDELSDLYSECGTYPSEPTLYEWELTNTDNAPFTSGGFGDCRRALFLGRHSVVMKCSRAYYTDRQAKRRAEREIRMWKGLQHPNVLPLIGSIVLGSPPRIFMVPPLMEKGNLKDYLKVKPDADQLSLLMKIAVGLVAVTGIRLRSSMAAMQGGELQKLYSSTTGARKARMCLHLGE